MEKFTKMQYKHTILAGLIAAVIVAFLTVCILALMGWFWLEPYL